MKVKIFAIFGIIVLVILTGIIYFLFLGQKGIKEQRAIPRQTPRAELGQPLVETPVSNMKISSSAFSHNEMIPTKYTCDGENISPPLSISEVPSQAQSLVLIADDPDAPGRTFVHWTLWNIDPKTTEIKEGEIPQGSVEGMTDFGKRGYGGPCPPSGTHRYFFKLYALDTKLELSPDAQKKDIEKAMEGHILDQTEIVGLYSRQK